MIKSDVQDSRLQPVPMSPAPDDTIVSQLDNGLTIVVREDRSAPVVSVQAWCTAGSIHEGKWLGGGLSHALEHMLFKGTTSRPGYRIDQEVQEAGGYMNAYTSFDRTVYHIDVPNTGAKVAIDVLCDIMQNASLPAEELAKEKQVILREMDMNVDDPGRMSSRRLFETAFTRSPYRYTVIGYRDIFTAVQPEDIRDYYRQHYAPNNVFFVVVGDVEAQQVLDQIRQAYSANTARAVPPSPLLEEPRQVAPRELTEEGSTELCHFHFAWHIPDIRHPDMPALDVLTALLGHGRSSRLYEKVRDDKGLVHSISAWTYTPGSAGLIGVSGACEPSSFGPARDAILAEIELLRSEPVPREELGKAVKQFTAGTLSTRKTMQGQAQDLGSSWLLANDLNFSTRYLGAVQAVSPEDVLRVAQCYLTTENRTVYSLMPSGTLPKRVSPTHNGHTRRVEMALLKNGLRLLVMRDPRLPFVDFRAVFRGGVLADTPGTSGISQLVSRLLLKGTSTRTAEDISRQVESVGGSIDTFSGNNSFGVALELMSPDLELGLDLFSDVVLNPAFPEPALERERQIQLADLRAQHDHLLQTASLAMRRALFGSQGYGLNPLGTEETLRSFRVDDLRNFRKLHMTPRSCVLAVFGDIEPEKVVAAVETAFGSWASPAENGAAPTVVISPGARRVNEARDKKQAVIVAGYPGVSMDDPARYGLELIQEACSDLGSRLFMRIREELGLAYYVGAQNLAGLGSGYFQFYVGTSPETARMAEEELLKQAAYLAAEGLTPDELTRTKAKLLGEHKIARQEIGHLATMCALNELYGLGYRHFEMEQQLYEAVTVEDTRSVAGQVLKANNVIVAAVNAPSESPE
jgi:zinc protease